MGAPKGNKYAVGNKGSAWHDKHITAELRNLTAKRLLDILRGTDEEFGQDKDMKKQVLLKLAGTILPRLLEHGNEDGEPLKIQLVNYGDSSNSVQVSAKTSSVEGSAESEEI